MAVDAVNAAGGAYVEEIDAQIPIEPTILDDDSNPDRTVSV
jgi:ABC-type branched-subunit amino acid transport system substrate-binding protein